MLKRIFATASFLVAATVGSSAYAGTVDTLYVTDGDSARLAIVQGNGPAVIKNTFVRGYPIAVRRDSIWLADYSSSNDSRQYDLAGNATGLTAAYSPIFAVDGAVNGAINYALGGAFSSSGTVYSANSDWTNQTALFSVSGSDLVGITFDTVFDSLWISDVNTIYQYSLAGALLSSFTHSSGRGSLAYEMSTDSLWYVTNGSNTITQYSKTGSLLQTVAVAGLRSNNWGAEFAPPVPIPAALPLLVTGLGFFGILRRRRN